MENLVTPAFWSGKRVLLTGHTGFKGSWLTLWLHTLEAEVTGFSLPPATTPNLYTASTANRGIRSVYGDLRDQSAVTEIVRRTQPEIILHLAAQALVREGYHDPVATYAINVMGTVHLLEAAKAIDTLKSIIVVTSDKCYENREWLWPYREDEALGGYDPYSSSKACTELVAAAYRRSFLQARGIGLATARAGNVFGGGDWSPNRLIPDLLAAFASGQPALLRNPAAIRPWQFVLEPLAGYLRLAERLYADQATFAQAWNFGPGEHDCQPVSAIAAHLASAWGESATFESEAQDFPHEAGQLRVDSAKARHMLGWQPRLGLLPGLKATVDWHKAWQNGTDMHAFSLQQIRNHMTP